MSPMLPISKLFKPKERQSRKERQSIEPGALQYDLERGRSVTPPLPSHIFEPPVIRASMIRNSHSAPPSMIPMQTLQSSSPPRSPVFDRVRFGEAYDCLEGTHPSCKFRETYVPPNQGARENQMSRGLSDTEPDLSSNRPSFVPWDPDVPFLPAQAYVAPGRSSDVEQEDIFPNSSMPDLTRHASSRYPSFAFTEDEGVETSIFKGDSRAQNIAVTESVQTNLADDGRQAQAIRRPTARVRQNPELFGKMTVYDQAEEVHEDYPVHYPASLHGDHIDPTDSVDPYDHSQNVWSPVDSELGDEDCYIIHTEDKHEERDNAHEHQSISSTDISWLIETAEEGEEMSRLTTLGQHNSPSTASAWAPAIDTFISAGSLDLEPRTDLHPSSQPELRRGQRFSVVMSNGTSARLVSSTELANSLNSIEALIKMVSDAGSSGSIDQDIDGFEAFHDHGPTYLRENSNSSNSKGAQIDQGPGSSQSLSSPSTNCAMGDRSGRHGRLGFYEELSSSHGGVSTTSSRKLRCYTPPLQLFGKPPAMSIETSMKPNSNPRSTLDRRNNRLIRAMQGNGVSGNAHLAHVNPSSKAENDWETVSDVKELDTGLTGRLAAEGHAGSSLADNSDSGSLPVPKQPIPLRQLFPREQVLQHPANPRENHSYVLVKDHQTGQTYSLPQLEVGTRGRLPFANATSPHSSQTRQYQHPIPFSVSHNHPFLSTPPQFHQGRELPRSVPSQKLAKQYPVTPRSRSSEVSEEAQKVKDRHAHESVHQLTSPDVDAADDDVRESPRELSSKEQSGFSSGWVSTTSETKSAVPKLPTRDGSFAKQPILGNQGNITGTPDGTGAREVGSSLADSSTPGAKLSSSPVPLTSSPRTPYKGTSRAGRFQTNINKSTSKKSAASRDCFGDENDEVMLHGRDWLEYLPPRRQQHQSSPTNGRHRRSSTESELHTGVEPQAFRPYERDNTSAGLLLRQTDTYSHGIRERRGNNTRIITPVTPSSTPASTPTRDQNGRVYTEVPSPVFIHPVYGRMNPWDEPVIPRSPHFGHGRQMAHPRPALRPVARAESPHLYHTPRQVYRVQYEYEQRLSFWMTFAFCVLPVMAIIPSSHFGDAAICLLSGGLVQQVDQTHKRVAAVVFGVGTPLLIVAIVMIVRFQAV